MCSANSRLFRQSATSYRSRETPSRDSQHAMAESEQGITARHVSVARSLILPMIKGYHLRVMYRQPQPQDASRLLDFFKRLVLLDPERVEQASSVNKISLAMERQWLRRRLTIMKAGELLIRIGDSGDKILVVAEIQRKPRWIERHVGEIRFGMIPGEGEVAKKVLTQIIEEARDCGIETLIYCHLQTQTAGLSIMRSLRFTNAGRIKRYYKRGGSYIDRVYLERRI